MKTDKFIWYRYGEEDIWLYTLDNGAMNVSFTNFGATIITMHVRARDGQYQNVVLSYDSFEKYLHDEYYLGCIVGRYANRIADGLLTIDGTTYHLPVNEPANNNHLHGGYEGFNKKVFRIVREESDDSSAAVVMHYRSRHMEEGYPGNLDVEVKFHLTATNDFGITYRAVTDQPTHINLTHHCYFNLGSGDGRQQQLQINAANCLYSNDRFLPTGQLMNVSGTPYDFTHPNAISWRWNQLPTKGYNSFYILDNAAPTAAVLSSELLGVSVEVCTSYPGILLYTGDYLGHPFVPNEGICLETQMHPDAMHHGNFPDTTLYPGQVYAHETLYRFKTTST